MQQFARVTHATIRGEGPKANPLWQWHIRFQERLDDDEGINMWEQLHICGADVSLWTLCFLGFAKALPFCESGTHYMNQIQIMMILHLFAQLV